MVTFIKKNLGNLSFFLTILGLLFLYSTLVSAKEIRTNLSTIELVSENASLPADGGKITLGFRLTPNKGWHAYWTNPGDAGLAAEMAWDLPRGFKASGFEFPAPHVIPFGPLVTYGYDEGILLLSSIVVPAGLEPGKRIRIGGKASWIVCDDQTCVPEDALVSLVLTVGDGTVDGAVSDQFNTARALVPEKADWPAKLAITSERVQIAVEVPEAITKPDSVYMFVGQKRLVKYDQQNISYIPGGIVVDMPAARGAADNTETTFLLAYDNDAGEHRVVEGYATLGDINNPGMAGAVSASYDLDLSGMLGAVLFAFLGGIVLNLMPCVLPVLSMKALSLVKLSHGDRKLARESGWFYTAGILVSFAAIGSLLVALRYGGQAAGWGFQMQYPLVNLSLSLLMVAVALNLFGLFEIGTSVVGAGQSLTRGGERKNAFFTGFLAVVVATPCTAPFMAGALGFAMTQPAAVSLAVFLSLGAGLAFPYLLLSLYPNLGRHMPKPGAWMDDFKRVLAFPMLLTAIWLMWVMGKQAGVNSLALGMVAATVLSFGLWAWGRSFQSAHKTVWHLVAMIALAGVIAVGYLVQEYRQTGTVSVSENDELRLLGGLELERFTGKTVADYVDAGQPIFVYFTADWCISCKVNERVALASDAVGSSFKARNIKVVEGDWTNQNPEITAWLQKFGRIGVPLYLYYPAGSEVNRPIILPQILTPSLVLEKTS